MGKTRHWCWDFFNIENSCENGKNVLYGTCKFCSTKYQDNATRMAKHLQVYLLLNTLSAYLYLYKLSKNYRTAKKSARI